MLVGVGSWEHKDDAFILFKSAVNNMHNWSYKKKLKKIKTMRTNVVL